MFKRLGRALYLSALISWSFGTAPLHSGPSSPPTKDCRDLQTLVGQMPPAAEDLFESVRRSAIEWGEANKSDPPVELAHLLSAQTHEAAALYLRPDIADGYDRWFFFHQFAVLVELYAKIFFPPATTQHTLPVVNTVLVLGTGTGIDIEALSSVIPLRAGHTRVVGLDYSEHMLIRAAHRLKRLRLGQHVKLMLHNLLVSPDAADQARLAQLFKTTPSNIQLDLILSMACLGQYFNHPETVGIIRDWIAPYLKVGGKLGFAIASHDALAFPNLEFTEERLMEHPWVRLLHHFGIELRGFVPIKGKTQNKYFLEFERVRQGTPSRVIVHADATTLERLAAMRQERPSKPRDPSKTIFPEEYYKHLRGERP